MKIQLIRNPNLNNILKYSRYQCSLKQSIQTQFRFNSSSSNNNNNNNYKNNISDSGNNEINKKSIENARNKETIAKSRLNLPPSFRSSHPLPKNQISEEELKQIQSNNNSNNNDNNNNNNNNNNGKSSEPQQIIYKAPWWQPLLKLSVVFVPCFVFGIGYIVYETYNDRPVFFPLWINSSVPLENAIGFENIDIEMLKEVARSNLLRRLNINHEIREYFGLPITLADDYETFDVRVEYNKLAVEGIELDFRKNWFKPTIKYREIDTPVLPTNINKYVQPLKMRGDMSGIDEDPDQDNIIFNENADYKIKIRGTIDVINEKIHRIEPGSGKITFDAEVDLDHTRLMKITGALMHFRNKNGSGSGGTLERLW
ncbi:hypothetical protein C6P40_001500 [Pichia californica]|uniref:Uncharacterized protein n=1 Tax=Pichia californica TaxID=460514 RepID=A0A9P7BIC7_9ASCO|nr:hypothetical protein C6P42_003005 [[Candida] californica]KAG0690768.1 hypothetical protein C6P40_001500 [[Candida] californica]